MSLTIKKMLLALLVLLAAACLAAQEQPAEETASTAEQNAGEEDTAELDLYYFNLPIVKIFTHPRGYYILYRTSNLKIGKMYVPWEWMDFRDQRAIYDTVRNGVAPYVSYVTNSGAFHQIRIHASGDLHHETWGVIGSSSVPDENFDIDQIELQF